MELQHGIAVMMREDEGPVLAFTRAGAKYHLQDCFITRASRSCHLTP